MKRYGVRLSVRPSVPFARCVWGRPDCSCGPNGQEISIDCCCSGARRTNAGSATLLAYDRLAHTGIGAKHRDYKGNEDERSTARLFGRWRHRLFHRKLVC